MSNVSGPPPYDPEFVRSILRRLLKLDEDALNQLIAKIEPYVRRTRRPLTEAVPKIAEYYQLYGELVQQLLTRSDESAWQNVLKIITDFAVHHHWYPKDNEGGSAPDLDAYNDVRKGLKTYNFEGSFDAWIISVVVRRLQRYWRSRHALRAGGRGYGNKTADESDTSKRVPTVSLDTPNDHDATLIDYLEDPQAWVSDIAQDHELLRMLTHKVAQMAAGPEQTLLILIWRLSTEEGQTLKHIAEQLELSPGQVYRRLKLIRERLQNDPEVRQWFDRDPPPSDTAQ